MVNSVIIIFVLSLIVYLLFLYWTFKMAIKGLIYFAETEHDWKIDGVEIKKILDYSIKKSFKDFFKR